MIKTLQNTKADIKSAIESKGVTVNGGMTTYAKRIRKIGLIAGGHILPNGIRLAHSKSSSNISKYDFSLYVDFTNMFYASEIESIPEIDTTDITTMYQCFYACTSLKSIPVLNCENISNISSCFRYCYNLTSIGGLANLGAQPNITCYYTFDGCTKITRQSCINIFNNLYDRTSNGYNIVTLTFDSNVIAKLSDDDIAIATTKGWNIIS